MRQRQRVGGGRGERDRQTDRQMDGQRQRHRDRQTERKRERGRASKMTKILGMAMNVQTEHIKMSWQTEKGVEVGRVRELLTCSVN